MRRLPVLALLVACGCSGNGDPLSVSGRILGADGGPLRAASVAIRATGFQESADVAPDGSFGFRVPTMGAYYLTATALHHQSIFRPVFVEDETRLTIRLAVVRLVEPIAAVSAIGAFNDWDDDDGLIPLRRTGEDTWKGTLAAPADTFAYQLMGVQVDEYPLAGTQADWYVPEREKATFARHAGKFVSVVRAPGDSVRIRFDAALVPRGSDDVVVEFADPRSRPARLSGLFDSFEATRDAFNEALDAHRAAGGEFATLEFDWAPAKRLTREMLDAERDSLLYRYMVLSYLEKLRADSADADVAERLLEDVPPASELWSFVWGIPSNMLARVAHLVGDPERANRYALRVADENPDRMVQASFLEYLVVRRFEEMKKEREGLLASESHTGPATREFSILYDRLVSDFGDTFYADMARQHFSPQRSIQAGNAIPALAARTLPDTSQSASLASLEGDVTLVEFWAIWCGPCIAEMPTLHEAYEKYAAQGLEIVSVSVDENPRDVAAFRAEEWPMPWRHLWLRDGWQSEGMKAFEVAGIPKPILFDREGRIIAAESELRHEKLLEVLQAVFENREAGPTTR